MQFLTNPANSNEKKRSERRKHCALAVVWRRQKFRPTTDPLPGGAGRPTFNQLEKVTTFTYRSSLVKIDARSFELSWVQSHRHTNRQTGPITIHCTGKHSAQCIQLTYARRNYNLHEGDKYVSCMLVFVGGKPGNFPLTGSDLPSHWFV